MKARIVSVSIYRKIIAMLIAVSVFGVFDAATAEQWRGLEVRDENRCSEYNRKRDYKYRQSIELQIVDSIGEIYSPYSGTCFYSTSETDIEHIVATSEAHDSGLCEPSRRDERRQFAQDLRNLTLASPKVNRHQKGGKDAAGWLPQLNKCWFAARVVEVKRAYSLSVDPAEAAALEAVLSQCESTKMVLYECGEKSLASQKAAPDNSTHSAVLKKYDDNGNSRISCKEARRHGIAPVSRDHPAYQYMRDGDGDGVVCE